MKKIIELAQEYTILNNVEIYCYPDSKHNKNFVIDVSSIKSLKLPEQAASKLVKLINPILRAATLDRRREIINLIHRETGFLPQEELPIGMEIKEGSEPGGGVFLG